MQVKVYDALKKALEKMEKTKAATPLLDAEVILCHVMKKDRWYLYTNRNDDLTEAQIEIFFRLIEKRLMGVPVQYIVGNQEFMGLDFLVKEGVLIPRPDTEILVEAVIEWAKNRKNKDVTIVDLGTGSGAITVSLAKYIEKSFVYSVDISKEALCVAKKNAESNGVLEKICFCNGDLLEPLKNKNLQRELDILVSNPPYIPREEIEGLQVEVAKYEPKLALDGGVDGLDFYRKIINEGNIYLRKGGLIALEVGHDQGEDVKQIMEAKGCYENIEKIKDLAGIERVVIGTVSE